MPEALLHDLGQHSFDQAAAAGLVNVQTPQVIQQRYVTICSIAPIICMKKENHMRIVPNDAFDAKAVKGSPSSFPQSMQYRTVYALEAAPGDGYKTLKVFDTAQWIRNVAVMTKVEFHAAPITCHELAVSLVKNWTGTVSATGDACLGIEIIPGDKPVKPELANLRAKQTRYAARMVEQADTFWFKREPNRITDLHKILAAWIGETDREWVNKLTHRATKDCVACTRPIAEHALRCEHCSADLVEVIKQALDYLPASVLRGKDPYCFKLAQRGTTTERVRARKEAHTRPGPQSADQPAAVSGPDLKPDNVEQGGYEAGTTVADNPEGEGSEESG